MRNEVKIEMLANMSYEYVTKPDPTGTFPHETNDGMNIRTAIDALTLAVLALVEAQR